MIIDRFILRGVGSVCTRLRDYVVWNWFSSVPRYRDDVVGFRVVFSPRRHRR